MLEQERCRAVLFTRFPVAGKAKTRLIPAVGPAGAAAVHKILTERSVAALSACDCQVEIAFTGAGEDAFRRWLGPELTYTAQVESDLSARLIARLMPVPALFFGADTPDLTADHVAKAIDALRAHDVVIGPAVDGGYYCIGVNGDHQYLFEDMPWSTDQVLPETLRRIEARNLSCAMLDKLRDCDTPEDLAHWPWLADQAGL